MYAGSKYWQTTYPKYSLRLDGDQYSLDIIMNREDEARVLGCCAKPTSRTGYSPHAGDGRLLGYVVHQHDGKRILDTGYHRLIRRMGSDNISHVTVIYAGKAALARMLYQFRNANGIIFYDSNGTPFGTPEHAKTKQRNGKQREYRLAVDSPDYDYLRTVGQSLDACSVGDPLPDDTDHIAAD